MAAVTGIRRAQNGQAGASMPAVLMYHSVSPKQPDPYLVTVGPGRFEQQMSWLARRGLRGVSVAELRAARARGRAGRSRPGRDFRAVGHAGRRTWLAFRVYGDSARYGR